MINAADPHADTLLASQAVAPDIVPGRFQILELAGQGGMGAVYRALDRELDDIVALKIMRPDLVTHISDVELFRKEVRLARRVTSPHVARTFDFGVWHGRPWLTMEYVSGEPLSRLLERQGRLDAADVVTLMRGVCAGLQAAHAVGVVHRDVKPANVLLAGHGRVVVTDFGVAQMALAETGRGGSPSGTLAYMAPEQVRGEAAGPSADVYAAGVMMFELLTGHQPWRGDTAYDIAVARLQGQAPDPRTLIPGLDKSLSGVVLRCLQREPSERWPDAQSLASALQAAMPGTDVDALPAVMTGRAPILAPLRPRVAVLPFQSVGGAQDDPLAEGLTEDLIGALSAVRDLRVLSRRVSLRFRDDPRDACLLGEELAVDAILEGSVRRTATGVRINVRLVRVADGSAPWSQRFDRTLAELLIVQDEIAAHVAAVLGVRAVQSPRLVLPDPMALELYVRGRQAYQAMRPDQIRHAVLLLQDAVTRAPLDASLGAAYALALVRQWYMELEPGAGVLAEVLKIAQDAVDMAPDLGDAHLAVAMVLYHQGQAAGAARALRQAVACSPSLAEAHELLGSLLVEIGRSQDGVRRLEMATELDPRLPTVWELLRVNALDGEWTAFDDVTCMAFAPHVAPVARWMHVLRYAPWRGRTAQLANLAATVDRELHLRTPDYLLTYLDAALDVLVRGKSPQRVYRVLDTHAAGPSCGFKRIVNCLQLKCELACFAGDLATARSALQRAVEVGLIDLLWLRHCPMLVPLHGDPVWITAIDVLQGRADAIMDALFHRTEPST